MANHGSTETYYVPSTWFLGEQPYGPRNPSVIALHENEGRELGNHTICVTSQTQQPLSTWNGDNGGFLSACKKVGKKCKQACKKAWVVCKNLKKRDR